jgi:hypothetical protein
MAMIDALKAEREQNKETMQAQLAPNPLEPTEEERERTQDNRLQAAAEKEAINATASLDLERWQRKALNAYHSGKGANVTFTSLHIPAVWHETITERLSDAQTEEQVKSAFDIIQVTQENGLLMLAAELKRANDLIEAGHVTP